MQGSSAQPELDSDFHDDVHGDAQPIRGSETPLSHGLNGSVVETGTQPVQQLHIADGAVAPDDDLEDHFTSEAPAPRLFRVVGFYLAEKTRRRDSAAGPIGPAADPAACPWSDTGAGAFAKPDPRSAACAATDPAAPRILTGRQLFQQTGAVARVSWSGDDGRNQRRERFCFEGLRTLDGLGNVHRGLRRLPPRQRAGDRLVTLALRLRRRRRLPCAAASTTAAGPRRRE